MADLSPIEKHDQDLALHASGQSAAKSHLSGLASALIAVVLCTAITYTTHFAFGFFTIIFGVLTGFVVKYLGKGTGARFGNIAGVYAVAAVVGYELILATFFVASNDPASIKGPHLERTREFLTMANSLSDMLNELCAAAIAYYIAFRIGKNPMGKDELDYLLEAKGIPAENRKISQRRRRR